MKKYPNLDVNIVLLGVCASFVIGLLVILGVMHK